MVSAPSLGKRHSARASQNVPEHSLPGKSNSSGSECTHTPAMPLGALERVEA